MKHGPHNHTGPQSEGAGDALRVVQRSTAPSLWGPVQL